VLRRPRREGACADRIRGNRGGLLQASAARVDGCSLDAKDLARRHCDECGRAFCWLCDAVVHDDPGRATHRRYPFGHVARDVSGSPSLVERLERALAAPLGAQEPIEPARASTAPERRPWSCHARRGLCGGEGPWASGVGRRRRHDARQNSRTVRVRNTARARVCADPAMRGPSHEPPPRLPPCDTRLRGTHADPCGHPPTEATAAVLGASGLRCAPHRSPRRVPRMREPRRRSLLPSPPAARPGRRASPTVPVGARCRPRAH